MKKRTTLAIILFFVMVFSILGCNKAPEKQAEAPKAAAAKKQDSAPLTIKVIDIGQGESILIRVAGQSVLIDTGDVEHRDRIVSYLKKEKITTLDKVIITHPHADHLGGMPGILENFKIGQIYDSGRTTTTSLYRQYLTSVNKKNIPFQIATPGSEIAITNDVKLKVLAPDKTMLADEEINNSSIVAKLTYDQFSMLFTGDAEKDSEKLMLRDYSKDLKSNVLKAGHHGSSSSSSPDFLKVVNPETVIISLAANNDYHHPHPSVMDRYKKAKMKIYRTDTDGTVTITSDGKTYSVSKEK